MATAEAQQVESGAAASNEPEQTLSQKIKTQVEYYFSKQNLLQDTFLQTKMDKDHYVELSVIAEFKLIKQLTTDVDAILASIKDSDKIVIDETRKRIRPAAINQRTTLILRNIPTDAERSVVEALLATVKLPKIVHLRSDVGNNWFATFETEESTKTAMELAKTLKWEGKAIGVGIKSEKGLNLGGPTSPQGSGGLPYYMSMNVGANGGYAAQNGGYNSLYVGGEGGNGNYRHGGRPGAGGRRGPGGANGGAMTFDGSDSAKRQAGGKKGKTKGGRDASGREGGAEAVRSTTTASKDSAQASINLADFPVLEANPAKKKDAPHGADDGDKAETRAKDGDAATETESGEASASAGGGAVAAAEGAPSEGQTSSPSPTKAGSAPLKKLSYAQMAQAAAAASAAPQAQPAANSAATAKASE